jgi:hypothetical protein
MKDIMKIQLERLLIMLTFAMLSFVGCRHNPVGPGNYKDPTKFTWTVDTIGTFQTTMRSIWGTSPTNLYIAGHASSEGGGLWHYDGKSWSLANLSTIQSGNEFGTDLSAVYGFSSNDIWAVGEHQYYQNGLKSYTCLVIHWNGSKWQEYPVASDTSSIGGLEAVGGSAPNDVWATGVNAVYHFNGSTWQNVQVPLYPQGIQFSSIVGINNSNVYMMGYRNDVVQPGDTTAYFLYHFDGTSWSVTDSVVLTASNFVEKFGESLFYVKGNLYTAGNGVFLQQGGLWTQLLTDQWVYFLGGNDINSLYAVGGLATAYWYGGKDWERLNLPLNQNVAFYGAWSDGNQTFVLGNDGLITYAVHGK